jgi:hypothetical protein
MEAFDLSFVFLNHDPIAINLVLLIKVLSSLSADIFLYNDIISFQAVALFNANCHDEAMRRLNDLAIADQHSHTRSRSIVNVSFMLDSMSFFHAEIHSSVIYTRATCIGCF